MKASFKTILIPAILSGLFVFSAPLARGEVAVSISVFHDQLAPHGRWVSTGSYGQVWAPSGIAAGWAPYVDGQWIYTDYGWTWASDDPWGDIAYHYGTWVWTGGYGWVWVPGTVWAPAWVTWAYSDDYIGWAPVPPSFALSAGGYLGRPVVLAQTRYVFVPSRQFIGTRVSSVRVPARQNQAIFRRTTKATRFEVSNGIVRTAGLPSARVERAAGRSLQRVSIEQARSRPTAFTAASGTRNATVPVVAPKSERARAFAGGGRAVEAPGRKAPASGEQASENRNAHAPRAQQPVERPRAEKAPAGSLPPQPKGQGQAQKQRAESQPHARPPQHGRAEHRESAAPHPAPPREAAPRVEHQPAPQPNPHGAVQHAPPSQRAKPAPHKPPNPPKPDDPPNPDQ
ncbi:MAG: DUF6600 domain-containing protein [Acidobacteriota bacterium]